MMTPFSLFAVLYMAALYLELAEKWTYPLFTLATLLLAIGIVGTRVTRITFLIFLAATTSHFLLVQFPDVANHVNIAIYCNLVMMAGIIFSLIRIRQYPTDDDFFTMIRPVLQMTVILVYFLAGFNKLNSAFMNPDVSCVRSIVDNLSNMATTTLVGIPAGLVVLAAPTTAAYYLLYPRAGRKKPMVVGVLALALLGGAALIALTPADETALEAPATMVLIMVAVVISWELLGGPLLAFPRIQLPLLVFSWIMHATLALIGFVDFGALALSLLFAFVPRPYVDLLDARLTVPSLGVSIHRAYLYLAINVLAGIVSGLGSRLVAGILFNLAALVFIWPLLVTAVAAGPKPEWRGVPITGGMTPKWMFAFPVILLLYGMTSYLGLRTAGNFTMFSNLRTEGPVSNHLLLRSNPLKVWGYQEDVVSFIDIDDQRARIGYQYQRLKGKELPVVEFRKLIYAWTMAGATVPMTFEYRGRIQATENIVNDPVWRTENRNWEMTLMDFRVIQPEGPNRCRW